MSTYSPAAGRSRKPEAPKPPRPKRRLAGVALLLIALLVGIGIFSAKTESEDSGWTPKLALDLQGGTQIILAPVLDSTAGNKEITSGDINQAISIIRQRVDASGVAEAEITSQAGNNIVVGLPGTPSEETLDLVERSAVLRFRPVLVAGLYPGLITDQDQEQGGVSPAPDAKNSEDKNSSDDAAASESTPTTDTDATNKASDSESTTSEPTDSEPTDSETADSESASDKPAERPAVDPEVLKKAAFAAADTNKDGKLSDTPEKTPSDPSDLAWITEQLLYEAYTLDCINEQHVHDADNPDKPMVACSYDHGQAQKYLLGPVELTGTDLENASSGPAMNSAGVQTGGFQVNLSFDNHGADQFLETTKRLISLEEPRNRFAVVLDGEVLTAPAPSEVIANGSARITGDFTAKSAATLANQLKFGSLPLTFEVQSKDQISATLGSEQLRTGLIAGLVGLLLVVAYMLVMYQGLGLVAISSIALATGITYLMLTLLGYTHGYRLSLPGVVGIIISIGITADSFIVYFERVRDEIRDGLPLRRAVDEGWKRALRTIVVSDIVNFVAAAVLYVLAIGGVRGFAFTLGLTTVIDLFIVVMFTRPILQLLVKTSFFGDGHPWSGMSPESLGQAPTYVGRGQRRSPRDKARIKAAAKDTATTDNPDNTHDAAARDHATAKVGARAAAPATSHGNLTIAQRKALAKKQAAADAAAKAAGEDNAPVEGEDR